MYVEVQRGIAKGIVMYFLRIKFLSSNIKSEQVKIPFDSIMTGDTNHKLCKSKNSSVMEYNRLQGHN